MKRFYAVVFLPALLFSLSLKSGLKNAVENDSDIQILKSDIKKIKYDQSIADGMFYPVVDFNSNIKTSKDTSISDKFSDSDEYKITVTQPLYDGGLSKYESIFQTKKEKSTQLSLKVAQNKLASEFVSLYLNLLKAKKTLESYQESYNRSDDIYKKIEKKVLSGYGNRLEYENAKGSLNDSLLRLTEGKLSYLNALEALRDITQTKINETELNPPPFLFALTRYDLESGLQYALKNNPSVLMALNDVDVAKGEYDRDLNVFKPTFNAIGSYGTRNQYYNEPTSIPSDQYAIGIEIIYNLYNGGKDEAQKNKALEQISDKKILIEKAKKDVINKFYLAWNQYQETQLILEKTKSLLVSKKNILEATESEFDLGTQDLTNVLTAQTDYIDTKNKMISGYYDLYLTQYKVLEAMGVLYDEIMQDESEFMIINGMNLKSFQLLSNIDNNMQQNDLNKKIEYQNYEELLGDSKQFQANAKDDLYIDQIIKENESINPLKNVDTKSETPKDIKNDTNSSFQKRFLKANRDQYTINLALFYTQEDVDLFLKNNDLRKNAFGFSFGEDKKMYKVMLGIFDSYNDAKKAIDNLSKELRSNGPRVEKISIKQDLYKKYHGMRD